MATKYLCIFFLRSWRQKVRHGWGGDPGWDGGSSVQRRRRQEIRKFLSGHLASQHGVLLAGKILLNSCNFAQKSILRVAFLLMHSVKKKLCLSSCDISWFDTAHSFPCLSPFKLFYSFLFPKRSCSLFFSLLCITPDLFITDQHSLSLAKKEGKSLEQKCFVSERWWFSVHLGQDY